MQSASNRTIAKVVTLGIVLALVAGVLSVMSYILSIGDSIDFIAKLGLTKAHAYVLPAMISVIYLGSAIAYYSFRIEKSLEDLML